MLDVECPKCNGKATWFDAPSSGIQDHTICDDCGYNSNEGKYFCDECGVEGLFYDWETKCGRFFITYCDICEVKDIDGPFDECDD